MPALDDVDLTDLDRFTQGFPDDVFTRLRREAPVWFHPATRHTPGGDGFWVVSRHADVVAAAADPARFSSEGGGGRADGGTLIEDLPGGVIAGVLLNMMDDPRHHERRRVLTPAVAARTLALLEPELAARAHAVVDGFVARGGGDVVAEVATDLPLQAMARLLGVPDDDRHRLFAAANATLDYDDRNLGEQSDRTRAAQAELFAYGQALVAHRRRDPGDDLFSAAVRAAGDGPEDDHELGLLFNLLVAAGSETTRNSLSLGLLALARHPVEWRRLRDDPGLVRAATEEILRWASSTPYNRRTATVDVEVRGVRIRAGDKVTLWWASANRDEAVFPSPFRFDVSRTPNPHLAFGHGTHFCLGAALARLEIRLVLQALAARATTLQVAGTPEWLRSNKHTGLRRLPMTVAAA